MRATRPPRAASLNDSSCLPGHNTPLPLKRSPPASFKRLLGRVPQPPGEKSPQLVRGVGIGEEPFGEYLENDVGVVEEEIASILLPLDVVGPRLVACARIIPTRHSLFAELDPEGRLEVALLAEDSTTSAWQEDGPFEEIESADDYEDPERR